MTKLLAQQLKQLPTEPGIYKYYDQDGELLYVGKAVNLRNRVKSYFTDKQVAPKTKLLVDHIAKLETIIVHSEVDALILEANLIKQFQPRFNIILKDDKSHLYIAITLYEDLPRVSTCRATDLDKDPKATYFGPYPSSGTVKRTLRYLRRVFPYAAHHQPPVKGRRRPQSSYFYYNLPLGQTDSVIDKQRYRRQIQQFVNLLAGQRVSVEKELQRDMRRAAKDLDFEKAAEIKQQLDGLAYLSQPTITPDRYVANPELVSEQRAYGLSVLADILRLHHPALSASADFQLDRIECYDISNLSGQQAVGSMVVFVAGEPAKRDYRKFRIRREQAPNDVAMLSEVLRRRFKRLAAGVAVQSSDQHDASAGDDGLQTHPDTSFSAMPNLIIVDGGKGQLVAAEKIISELGLIIPVVGLTKRDEELVFARIQDDSPASRPAIGLSDSSQGRTGSSAKPRRSSAHGAIAQSEAEQQTSILHQGNFITVRLARGSQALFLIQRIRDEAHRFAINYHRKLRSKALLKA